MKDVAHWFWWFTVRDRVVRREFQLLITAAGSSWSPPGVFQEVRGPVGPSSWTGPHIKEVQLFLWTRWSWTASDRKPKDNWKLQRRPDWHIRCIKRKQTQVQEVVSLPVCPSVSHLQPVNQHTCDSSSHQPHQTSQTWAQRHSSSAPPYSPNLHLLLMAWTFVNLL